MKQYLAGKIRNIAVVGHGGSGKTSLTEALLYKAGATDRLGKIADGNTVCDFDSEEIKRQVSVSSAIAPFAWGSTKINIIDTPGLFDYVTGMYEGIRACESVLITISAKDGYEVGTEKAYKLACQQNKSKMIFITKLDVENTDFYNILAELKANIGPSVCPLVVPIMENDKISCYINLVDDKAYKYNENGEISEVAMPDTGHRLDGLKVAISEAVAETDEELFEKYFSGEQFTRDEIIRGIHTGVKSGAITPVLCGSAVTLEGIDMLLDAIVDHLPSAYESGAESAINEEGELVTVPCTDEAPLVAYVFKTIADPFIGKMSFVKIVSGKLSAETPFVNVRTGESERIGKIIYVKGKKQEDTAFITAGDIGAVTKLSEVQTGDTLCDPKNIMRLKPIEFPKSTMTMAVKVHAKGDEGKVAQGIQRLMEEDPTIKFEQNSETHQQLITGMGEQHLDVICSKIKNKFGINFSLTAPKVAYRETIRSKVKVQGKHKKQSGGHGQFGDVWIEFEPTVSDELVFEESVFGGAVPKNFFPAVEKGLQDCVKKGVLAGYPMVGLKATLVDGSYHPVDSSEMAFKMAASIAYKTGIPQAKPVLLEPIGTLKVYVTDDNTGDIIGEMNKRRGRILGMNPTEEGFQEIIGEVPMSEMYDFTTVLRSITQGRGFYELNFERYEQLPQNLEAKVIEEAQITEE